MEATPLAFARPVASFERRKSNANREDPPDIISYRDQHGKRTDRRQSIKLERGAKDLANYREQKVKAEEREQADLVRAHADALRSARQGPIDAQQRQPERQQAPQGQAPAQTRDYAASQPGELSAYDRQLVAGARDPQVRQSVQATQAALPQRLQELDAKISEAYSQGQPWQELLGQEYQRVLQAHEQVCFVDRAQLMMQQGLSPKVAAAVSDRETLEWMQQATNGYEQAYQAAVEKHEQNCMELIGALEGAMLWMFPELQHNADPKAVIAIARQQGNGKRADDISRWYAQFEQAVQVGQQARQRNEQEKREKFQTWARNQDNIFRSKNPEFVSPEHQKQVANEAFEYLESLGITREETIKLHDEDIMFRSHVGQQVLLDALKFRHLQKAKANLPNKRYREPTQTIKPGSAETYLEPRGEQLPASFSGKQSGLREAAAILSNRRARKR